MSPLRRTVCTTEEMQQRVVYKVAMAYGVPIALLVSATVTWLRSTPDTALAAFCLWVCLVVIAAVSRVLLVRSMRRDLAELHRRWSRPPG
jgi:hypothetical protein